MKRMSWIVGLTLAVLPMVFAGPAQETGSAELVKSGPGPLAPYEETIVVTVPDTVSPDVTYIDGESVEDNVIKRKFLEVLNIDYQLAWVADATQYNDKINLAIASNDLPDTFHVTSPEMLGRVIAAGQVENVRPAYEQYANDFLKETFGWGDGVGFHPATTVDGEYLGLPLPAGIGGLPLMWIRSDWLAKLGLEAPTTLAEFNEVARAFVEDDPDGNGVNDTFAFNLSTDIGMALDGLGHAFGAYHNIWIEKDGNLEFSSIQPEMRDALAYLQDMYAKGYIDREFAVKDEAKIGEDYAQGRAGIYFGGLASTIFPLMAVRQNDPDAAFVAYPIVKNADGEIRAVATSPFAKWQVVRKGFEYPEAIVKSLNLGNEMFMGEYSEWFQDLAKGDYMNVTHYEQYILPSFFEPARKNFMVGDAVTHVIGAADLETGYATLDEPGQRVYHHITTVVGFINDPAMDTGLGYAFKSIFGPATSIQDEIYVPNMYLDRFSGVPPKAMIDHMSNLQKLGLESFVKIIVGAPISDFDTYVERWHDLGGAEITSAVNEWYREQ